jgi:hypothetical protein
MDLYGPGRIHIDLYEPIMTCMYHIYTKVAEVYIRDRSKDVNDVDGLAAVATKHLEFLKQKDRTKVVLL